MRIVLNDRPTRVTLSRADPADHEDDSTAAILYFGETEVTIHAMTRGDAVEMGHALQKIGLAFIADADQLPEEICARARARAERRTRITNEQAMGKTKFQTRSRTQSRSGADGDARRP